MKIRKNLNSISKIDQKDFYPKKIMKKSKANVYFNDKKFSC